MRFHLQQKLAGDWALGRCLRTVLPQHPTLFAGAHRRFARRLLHGRHRRQLPHLLRVPGPFPSSPRLVGPSRFEQQSIASAVPAYSLRNAGASLIRRFPLQGVMIRDFRLIARNYLSGWFMPDFLGYVSGLRIYFRAAKIASVASSVPYLSSRTGWFMPDFLGYVSELRRYMPWPASLHLFTIASAALTELKDVIKSATCMLSRNHASWFARAVQK